MYCLFSMTMVLSWEKGGEEVESTLIPKKESLKVSWEKGLQGLLTLRKNTVRYQFLESRGHGGEA